MSPDGFSANSSTNIRVFVHWQDHIVFAGDDVKCTITFRNVARPPQPNLPPKLQPLSSSSLSPSRQSSADGRPRQPSPLSPAATRDRAKNNVGLLPPPAARSHRSTLSLSVPSAASRARAGSIPWSPPANLGTVRSSRNGGHKRSVSIVSIGSVSTVDDAKSDSSTATKTQRSIRGHARASSLQIVPRGLPLSSPRSGQLSLEKRVRLRLLTRRR